MHPSLETRSLGLGFSMLVAGVVQPSTHLSCVSVTSEAADE